MSVPPVVAVEIGTTKVIALVGEMREDNCIMISGVGECASKGVRKGDVVDVEAVTGCVRRVLEIAEEPSKVSIRSVFLALSGSHVQSLCNRGTVPVPRQDSVITTEDIEQVQQVARAVNLPPEREILHSISQHYCIDDQERVIRPEGMSGARLTHDMLLLHCLRNRLDTTVRCVRAIPTDVDDVVFSGIASSVSVLTPEQKRSGVLLIDMGGGKTDYVAYGNQVVTAAGVLAVGGDHITNDIAVAFNISASQAERLKRDSATAWGGSVSRALRVSLPAELGFPGRSVNLSALHTVVRARVEEMLAAVKARIEKENVHGHLGAGVVLTGGGAHLKGLPELAEHVFGLPCSVGRPRGFTGVATVTDGPEYATCSGLLQYGFKEYQEQRRSPLVRRWFKEIFGR